MLSPKKCGLTAGPHTTASREYIQLQNQATSQKPKSKYWQAGREGRDAGMKRCKLKEQGLVQRLPGLLGPA